MTGNAEIAVVSRLRGSLKEFDSLLVIVEKFLIPSEEDVNYS